MCNIGIIRSLLTGAIIMSAGCLGVPGGDLSSFFEHKHEHEPSARDAGQPPGPADAGAVAEADGGKPVDGGVPLPPLEEPVPTEGCFVEAIMRDTCTNPELFNEEAEEHCRARGDYYVPYLHAEYDGCPDGEFFHAEYWCCPNP
jgi:hypothetical protein